MHDVAALLPHQPPMRLLDELLAVEPDDLLALADPRHIDGLGLPRSAQRVFALELLAQTAAAYAALAARATAEAGRAPPTTPGMLLGSRSFELMRAIPDACAWLTVHIRRKTPLLGAGLAKFSGTVWALESEAIVELRDALGARKPGAASVATLLATQYDGSLVGRGDLSVYLPNPNANASANANRGASS